MCRQSVIGCKGHVSRRHVINGGQLNRNQWRTRNALAQECQRIGKLRTVFFVVFLHFYLHLQILLQIPR